MSQTMRACSAPRRGNSCGWLVTHMEARLLVWRPKQAEAEAL